MQILKVFSAYSYGLNPGPLAQDHFGPGDLRLDKHSKKHLAILHTKFQASEPSCSEEEDFLFTKISAINNDLLEQGHLRP